MIKVNFPSAVVGNNKMTANGGGKIDLGELLYSTPHHSWQRCAQGVRGMQHGIAEGATGPVRACRRGSPGGRRFGGAREG